MPPHKTYENSSNLSAAGLGSGIQTDSVTLQQAGLNRDRRSHPHGKGQQFPEKPLAF